MRELVAVELAGLLGHDESTVRLRRTALAFLRSGANARAAADLLGTHRNTVLYRVRRAEELLGRPMDDGRLRLELALTLADVFGERVQRGGRVGGRSLEEPLQLTGRIHRDAAGTEHHAPRRRRRPALDLRHAEGHEPAVGGAERVVALRARHARRGLPRCADRSGADVSRAGGNGRGSAAATADFRNGRRRGLMSGRVGGIDRPADGPLPCVLRTGQRRHVMQEHRQCRHDHHAADEDERPDSHGEGG